MCGGEAQLSCSWQSEVRATESGFSPVSERVLVESSINSVRISLNIKQADELEEMLVRKFVSFLQQRCAGGGGGG